MAEELPGNDANPRDESLPAGTGAGPLPQAPVAELVDQRRGLPWTWIILGTLLLLVLAMYASDVLRGRMPQDAAFKQINEKLKEQQRALGDGLGFGGQNNSAAVSAPLTAQAVHELLGREPNQVDKKNLTLNEETVPVLVETYRYPGIIKNYDVVVTYLEDDSGKDPPATMLKFVRKQ